MALTLALAMGWLLALVLAACSGAARGQYCTMPPSPLPLPRAAAAVAPPAPRSAAFEVIWNMATSPCRDCANASQRPDPQSRGVVANANQTFNGAEVVCLYRFGLPPRLRCTNLTAWPTPPGDISVVQNGGVPQSPAFNLSLHLQQLRLDIARWIPNPGFSGYALVDKEDWEPLFCSNWVSGGQRYYNIFSEELVRKQHPDWTNEARITEEAAVQWDRAAKEFYLASLTEARKLRPLAEWGYFGQPTAFSPRASPAHKVSILAGNQRLGWLFQAVDFLAPEVYIQQRPEQESPSSYPSYTDNLTAVVATVVSHSIALADAASAATAGARRPKVMPYGSIIYRDLRPQPPPTVPQPYMIEQQGLVATIQVPASLGAEGVFLWGSGDDTNTCNPNAGCVTPICAKCGVVASFLDGQAGDAIGAPLCSLISHLCLATVYSLRKCAVTGACIAQRERCAKQRCSGHGRCVDDRPPAGGRGSAEDGPTGEAGSCRCDIGWGGTGCGRGATAPLPPGGLGR